MQCRARVEHDAFMLPAKLLEIIAFELVRSSFTYYNKVYEEIMLLCSMKCCEV